MAHRDTAKPNTLALALALALTLTITITTTLAQALRLTGMPRSLTP
jgi:hypothetical protein